MKLHWTILAAILAGLAAMVITDEYTSAALKEGDPGWVPRLGEISAKRYLGECGQIHSSGSFGVHMHRIECPQAREKK